MTEEMKAYQEAKAAAEVAAEKLRAAAIALAESVIRENGAAAPAAEAPRKRGRPPKIRT